jgi:hypothetical protein
MAQEVTPNDSRSLCVKWRAAVSWQCWATRRVLHVFWLDIGHVFRHVVQACSQCDIVPASWASAVISLLFKKGERTDIKD